MTNPSKVLAFLDLAAPGIRRSPSSWAAPLPSGFVPFRIAARRTTSLSGEPFHWPTAKSIDARLIGGSLLFGVGWGLVGLCPGPAIADIGYLDGRAALFVLSMAAGMAFYSGWRSSFGADLRGRSRPLSGSRSRWVGGTPKSARRGGARRRANEAEVN